MLQPVPKKIPRVDKCIGNGKCGNKFVSRITIDYCPGVWRLVVSSLDKIHL